jgi:hypothetical protein
LQLLSLTVIHNCSMWAFTSNDEPGLKARADSAIGGNRTVLVSSRCSPSVTTAPASSLSADGL